jgi:heat shock protein HslJ
MEKMMKKTPLFLISLFILAGLTLAACASVDVSLAGTSWKLVSFGPKDSPTPALADAAATLTFDKDGKLNGNGGCNNFFGDYKVSGSQVTFGAVGATMMACVEPIMQQESAVVQVLAGTADAKIDGDTLTIVSSDGASVLVFKK